MLKGETKEVGKARPVHKGPVEESGLFPENSKTLNNRMISSNFSFRKCV